MEIRDVNRPWFRNHLMSALGRYLPVVTGGYRPRDDITLELVGSNLTDEYYIDPTTRSAVAAPGRALKLSLTAQF